VLYGRQKTQLGDADVLRLVDHRAAEWLVHPRHHLGPGDDVAVGQRRLLRLDTTGRLPRLFFTEAGIDALRTMMADRRLADPEKFAHIRQELGIDPSPESDGEPATESAAE